MDVYLQGWHKGVAFVNGHNLGRYWKIGPQKTLYVPAPWLKEGKNTVSVKCLLFKPKGTVKICYKNVCRYRLLIRKNLTYNQILPGTDYGDAANACLFSTRNQNVLMCLFVLYICVKRCEKAKIKMYLRQIL